MPLARFHFRQRASLLWNHASDDGIVAVTALVFVAAVVAELAAFMPPDGKTAYVTNRGSNTVTPIDITTAVLSVLT